MGKRRRSFFPLQNHSSPDPTPFLSAAKTLLQGRTQKGEVFVKMFFQSFAVFIFKFVHGFEEAFPQTACQNGTVGDMEHLTGFGHFHQGRQLGIGQRL